MESVIKTEKLGKSYSDGQVERWVLSDVDIELPKEKLVVISGPSGSGKSTLLHIFGGLILPSKGRLWVGGQEVEKLKQAKLADYRKKTIGFVFQSFFLMPGMSALHNVAYPLQLAGIARYERETIAYDLLKKVGLETHIFKTPEKLSGGEKQRVAIARALVCNPSIILADEPTGNLDSRNGDEIMTLLMSMRQQGKTVIVVSHDPNHLDRADVVIRMLDGHVEGIYDVTS